MTAWNLALAARQSSSVTLASNPRDVAVSPDGLFAYVSAYAANSVTAYTRNTVTGALTFLATYTGVPGSGNVVISSDGLYLYVASYTPGAVYSYTRNAVTGALTALGTAITAGAGCVGLKLAPDGTTLYTANQSAGSVSVLSRNTSTGVLTASVPASIAAGALSIDVAITSDGQFVYCVNQGASTISQYSRNTGTGVLTLISNLTVGSTPNGICLSADNTVVFISCAGTNSLVSYTRNVVTGVLTLKASITIPTAFVPRVSPDGKSLYCGSNAYNIYQVYLDAGNNMSMANVYPYGSRVCGVVFFGQNFYAAAYDVGGVYVYTVDALGASAAASMPTTLQAVCVGAVQSGVAPAMPAALFRDGSKFGKSAVLNIGGGTSVPTLKVSPQFWS
jgi:6-phosphogluconolactonase (cycloisomerase 2 family)